MVHQLHLLHCVQFSKQRVGIYISDKKKNEEKFFHELQDYETVTKKQKFETISEKFTPSVHASIMNSISTCFNNNNMLQ